MKEEKEEDAEKEEEDSEEEVLEEEKEVKEEPIRLCPYCNESKGLSKFAQKAQGCRDCRVKRNQLKLKKLQSTAVITVKEKVCSKCNILLPSEMFFCNRLAISGLAPECKLCLKLKKTKKVENLNKLKLNQSCQKCGYNTNPKALDFAHINRKEKAVCASTQKPKDILHLKASELKQELAKTKLMCKMCHRQETNLEEIEIYKDSADEKRTIKRLKLTQQVNEEKMKRSECVDCHIKVTDKNVDVFYFDHKDKETRPRTKYKAGRNLTVALMVSTTKNIEYILEQIKLCDLRCGNCSYLRMRADKETSTKPRRSNAKPRIFDPTENRNKKQKLE